MVENLVIKHHFIIVSKEKETVKYVHLVDSKQFKMYFLSSFYTV